MNLLEEIVLTLSKIPEKELNNEILHKVKKEITRKYRVNSLPTNIPVSYTHLTLPTIA
jgi:hypothetical protein